MLHAPRAILVALLAGLIVVVPVAAAAAPPSAPPTGATFDAAGDPALSPAKVVIIVGATHGATSNYRAIADSAYAEAIKWSSNVVRVYSPNATWEAVKPALQGASVVLYLGHGNGWPSPYTYDPNFTTKNGLGLNATANNGDNNTKYYGEPYLANEIRLAPNAVVLLNHLCYASGNSEPGYPDPTLNIAMQRVDNYGAGFIRAGARAVIAEGLGSVNGLIRDLFTTHQTVLDAWRNQYNYNGNEFSFQSSRSPGYTAFMDPTSPAGGYYRSIVGNPDLRTEDVTGVSFTRTDAAPSALVAPGAATVASAGAALFSDSTLTSPSGSIAGGTAVRVESLVMDPQAAPIAASIRPLTGGQARWASATDLVPQDSTSPQLWGIDGTRTISPNGDGLNDALSLTVRFSESVSWTLTISGGSGVLWTASGTGDQAVANWDAKVGGAPISDGAYAMSVRAQDSWGNARLDTNVAFSVDSAPPTRLAGADRFATAAAISAASFAPGVPVAYVATGLNFPDALAGAAVAGAQGAPILLVNPDSVPAPTIAELTRLQPGRIVILGSSGVVSDGVAGMLSSYTTGGVFRLAGADRFATAAAISAASFAPGVPVAYVATGLNFPDALAGAPVAGAQGAPILLVMPDSVPSSTAAELARLQPGRIVILGSSGVVSDGVAGTLSSYTTGGVFRLAGADRFATAAAISAASFAPGVPVAYVATGLNFPDALAGAAVAGAQGAPILLVNPDSVPAATGAEITRLRPGRIVVLGSTGVVSEAVRIQLLQLLGG